MRQTGLSPCVGIGLVVLTSCAFDKVGFLGANEEAGPGAAGNGGGSGMWVGSAGHQTCGCPDESEACNAEGDCVPRCQLGGTCDQEPNGSNEQPLVEAFGCAGEPVSADVLDAPWAETDATVHVDVVPANQHLLIERSSTMSEAWSGSTRWDRVLDALLRVPGPHPGTQRTLRFFPTTVAGEGSATACDPLNYTNPVAVYDGSNFNATSMLSLVAMLEPAGDNPLVPAVAGALQGIVEQRSTSTETPDQLVLVLGSMPDQCIEDPSLEVVATLVRQARELEPPILTSVVAVGDDLDVDPIAEAGGTKPFRIDGSDEELLLVRALNAGQTCHGVLPSSERLRLPAGPEDGPIQRIEVYVTLGGDGGSVEAVPQLASASDCLDSAQGGWYLPDPADPSQIALCDCTLLRASCGELYILGSTAPAENGTG